MNDYKCHFVATLIKEDFACEKAQMVTRRAGPDIACACEGASGQCRSLLSVFKVVGLPAFNAKDDLLKTPHSVYSKIQFGGLLALAADIKKLSKIERIENIYQLIEQALKHYEVIDNFPVQEYTKNMVDFKIKRNKRPRKLTNSCRE